MLQSINKLQILFKGVTATHERPKQSTKSIR
jgi:hypothetical protein